MYRQLASALIVASAIQAKFAGAVSLGEMTMQSALNQPLQAEIRLSHLGELNDSQILVKLASQKEFDDAGIDKTFFLTNVKFAVELDGNGHGIVKLSSHKRLNEPFLDFLVEAKWPAGKILRSYTVLVDLPAYNKSNNEVINLGTATEQALEETKTPTASLKKPKPVKSEPTPIEKPERVKSPAPAVVVESAPAEVVESTRPQISTPAS